MDLRSIAEFFRDISKYIIIFVVMVVIFFFVISFQPVAGNSMHPTLKEGNVVAVLRLGSNYKRNNIIVFKDSNGKSFIKRIIGLPGEEVNHLNGILYIDGNAFRETFLDDSVVTSNFMFVDICDKTQCPEGKIPDDMYLVLGDNRPDSEDSRSSSIRLIKKQI